MLKIYSSVSQSHRGKRIFREMIRKKFTKADVIKRLMREQKQCFGALLETKQERNQRSRFEKKGIVSVTPPAPPQNNVDSELAWVLSNTPSRLQVIRINPESRSNIPSSSKNIISQNQFGAVPFAPKIKTVGPRTVKITGSKAVKITAPDVVNITAPEVEKITAPEAVEITASKEVKITAPIAMPSIAPIKTKEFFKPLTKNKSETVDLKSESEDESTVDTQDPCFENITRASLFTKKAQDCAVGWDSTILSISTMKDQEFLKFPSVTKILNATMSDSARGLLEMWMARMIRDLGQDGFDAYKKDLLANGKQFHSLVDNALRKMPVEVPATLRPCFNSVQTVLKEIKEVRAIESHVVHRELGYHGVLDCVASYRGNLCLIDWKKSDKPKDLLSSTYDAPLQIASYIGALNSDTNYPFQIKRGVVAIAYTTGRDPMVYQLDETILQIYWKQWLNRLKKYYQMQSS